MGDNEMRRGRQTAGGVPLHLGSCVAEIPLLVICLKYLYLIADESPGKRCESPAGTQSLCPPGLGFQSPLRSHVNKISLTVNAWECEMPFNLPPENN